LRQGLFFDTNSKETFYAFKHHDAPRKNFLLQIDIKKTAGQAQPGKFLFFRKARFKARKSSLSGKERLLGETTAYQGPLGHELGA
jgi:hypothetical protein